MTGKRRRQQRARARAAAKREAEVKLSRYRASPEYSEIKRLEVQE